MVTNIKTYSEDQRDCLQEICNVAMGHAANALAREYNVFITLSIPVIKMLSAVEFPQSLRSYQSDDHVYAASQLFSSSLPGRELSGLALVILSDESLHDLQELAARPISTEELVVATCRILAQTCLDALSEQWALGFQCQSPELVAGDHVNTLCDSLIASWQRILMVDINYRIEGRKFSGDLLLLFPDQAIDAMAGRLDALLA